MTRAKGTFVWLLLLLGCSCNRSCGDSNERAAQISGGVAAETAEAEAASDGSAASDAAPSTRAEAVHAELARYDAYDVVFDASDLSDTEKAMLQELLRAAALIEDLNLLQAHPQNLEWRSRIEATGSDDDKELFRRMS